MTHFKPVLFAPLALLSLISLANAWAGCGPPQCPWFPTDDSSASYPLHPGQLLAGTIVDCAKACASCGEGNACYCDPISGYSCGGPSVGNFPKWPAFSVATR